METDGDLACDVRKRAFKQWINDVNDLPPIVPSVECEEDQKIRLLWLNVLLQASHDAEGSHCHLPKTGPTRDFVVNGARKWFDIGNKEFLFVCEMADVEPRKALWGYLHGR